MSKRAAVNNMTVIVNDAMEKARNEGRRDALVNLKKFIRDDERLIDKAALIALVDEFMGVVFGPNL